MKLSFPQLTINLNDNEKIIYTCEKNSCDFLIIVSKIVVGMLITFLILFLPIHIFIKMTAFIFIFSALLYELYINIEQYFTTSYLTNNKIVLINYKKQVNIIFNDIESIYTSNSRIQIKLKNECRYNLNFINGKTFKTHLNSLFLNIKESNDYLYPIKKIMITIFILGVILPSCIYTEFIAIKIQNQKLEATKSKIAVDSYLVTMRQQIQKKWYPEKISQTDQLIIIQFDIDRDGYISGEKILQPSKNKQMNVAAILAIERASPFEPLPKDYKDEKLSVQFTFDYNISKK